MNQGLKLSELAAAKAPMITRLWSVKVSGESLCVIQNTLDARTLELQGELAASFRGDGKLLRQVVAIDPSLSPFQEAYDAKQKPLLLEQLLKGAGWQIFFLELTGRCNENCVHCYASSSPQVSAALSWKTIERVINEVSLLGFSILQLTGGDPLISPHIEKAIRLAARLKFQFVEVYTNGLAFNHRLARLFASLKIGVAFSLYSHEPETHDEVTRTPGSFRRTVAAITLALSLGIKIRVNGVQGCSSEQDEHSLRKFLNELGVPLSAIGMDQQRPVGRGQWQENVKLLASSEVTRSVHGGMIDDRPITDSTEPRPFMGKLSLNYRGEVTPCIFQRNHVLGLYENSSLREILAQVTRPKQGIPMKVISGEPIACADCHHRSAFLDVVQIGPAAPLSKKSEHVESSYSYEKNETQIS